MAVAGYFNGFEHIFNASPYKPPLRQAPFNYGLPSINETYSAVCFCCFATDVPLTNAAKCKHKDFVNVYLLMAPSVPLLICNICHHMLKKIDDFRLQIQNNFTNLVSKKEPDERCIIVNNLHRNPTILMSSLNPMPVTNTESQENDPLSVVTMPLEVDTQDSMVHNLVGTSRLSNEVATIKTEPDEADTALSQTTTNTNMLPTTAQYYIELNSIKQEMLPPTPPPTLQGPFGYQKKLDQPIITINNGLILLNPLKNNNEINATPMILNNHLKIPTPKLESSKQIDKKVIDNQIIKLETSDLVNMPSNLQQKHTTEQIVESTGGCIEKVTNNDSKAYTNTEIGKLLKNYDDRVLEWKQKNKGANCIVDESYKDKIDKITLTEAEIIKERDDERLEESFAKNEHRCESCIETFPYNFSLDRHNERFHSKKNNDVECPICKRRYMSERNMEDHSIKHFVRYVCLVCDLRSKTLPSLTEHFNKTHTDKEPIKKKYNCEDCDFVSHYRDTYNHHTYNNHKPFMCKVCNKKLTGNASYRYHMKYCHDDIKVTKKKAIYKCDQCTASFPSCGLYTSHKKALHPPPGEPVSVFCQPCNKFYSNKVIYKTHLKYSTAHSNGNFKFECDHCHKKYPHKPTLQVHIQRHHLKSLNLKCKICNKLYAVKRDLKQHVRQVHINKTRPREVCYVCGKDYASKPVLKKHMRIHTGERPHACDLCGMTFTQSATLATHKKLKHKIPKKREIVKENIASAS